VAVSAVDKAIPEAGKVDAAQLARIDADTLARYVIDDRRPWWRRRPCVEALRGRVPESLVPLLLDRIRDGSDVAEVRVALLDLVGERTELLPFLQTLTSKDPYGVYEHGLAARGRLGDLTAADQLADIAASHWKSRAECGERGLDGLVRHHGRAAIVERVGRTTPAARIFANRMRSIDGDLTGALADPDVVVARRAVELIVATGRPDNDHLLDHVVTGPTLAARLWAIYALHLRGRDVCDLWRAIDAPRLELPWLSEAARLAILHEYPGELATDPRWLVERACVELPEPPDEAAHLARAISALRTAGLAAGEPVDAGKLNGTGAGTYYEIASTNCSVMISTLGRFASGDYESWDGAQPERQALEAAGFEWIDDALGQRIVEGLAVYHFGNREPIQLHTLLFYWQD
jgi:hypothetical protein